MPRVDVTLRPPAPEDFEAIGALMAELAAHRPPFPSDEAARAPIRATYERHLARIDRGEAFSRVAVLDGEVVGFVGAERRERLGHAEAEVWVGDLIVARHARERGIGKKLVLDVLEAADKAGAFRLVIDTAYDRTVSHELYDRLGFENTGRFYSWRFEAS